MMSSDVRPAILRISEYTIEAISRRTHHQMVNYCCASQFKYYAWDTFSISNRYCNLFGNYLRRKVEYWPMLPAMLRCFRKERDQLYIDFRVQFIHDISVSTFCNPLCLRGIASADARVVLSIVITVPRKIFVWAPIQSRFVRAVCLQGVAIVVRYL